MSSLRFSRVPALDTALKLVTIAVAMFAFVFVVMVPLYNVPVSYTHLTLPTRLPV